MLDFLINNPPPTIPANSTYTTIIACPLVSIKNPVTLDTTEAEPTAEPGAEEMAPEQPVQEQPKDYLRRIHKSVVDEFLNEINK